MISLLQLLDSFADQLVKVLRLARVSLHLLLNKTGLRKLRFCDGRLF
jgi:hypothetical protein